MFSVHTTHQTITDDFEFLFEESTSSEITGFIVMAIIFENMFSVHVKTQIQRSQIAPV